MILDTLRIQDPLPINLAKSKPLTIEFVPERLRGTTRPKLPLQPHTSREHAYAYADPEKAQGSQHSCALHPKCLSVAGRETAWNFRSLETSYPRVSESFDLLSVEDFRAFCSMGALRGNSGLTRMQSPFSKPLKRRQGAKREAGLPKVEEPKIYTTTVWCMCVLEVVWVRAVLMCSGSSSGWTNAVNSESRRRLDTP